MLRKILRWVYSQETRPHYTGILITEGKIFGGLADWWYSRNRQYPMSGKRHRRLWVRWWFHLHLFTGYGNHLKGKGWEFHITFWRWERSMGKVDGRWRWENTRYVERKCDELTHDMPKYNDYLDGTYAYWKKLEEAELM